MGIIHTELVRAQSPHTVIRPALCIAFNKMVHGGAAVEDQLKLCFQRDYLGKSAQCVIFPKGMTGKICRLENHSSFTQTGGLRLGYGCQRDLGKLRQVEQPFGMPVCHAARGKLFRVIAHNSKYGETEPAAGKPVCALPHLAGCQRLRALIKRHALLLDTLPGEHVSRHIRAAYSSSTGYGLFTDAACHFNNDPAVIDFAYALNADLNAVIQLDHTVHGIRPSCDLIVRTLGICRLHNMLRSRGQPHPVDQRGLEPRYTRCTG